MRIDLEGSMNPVKAAFVTVCGQATKEEVEEEYNYLFGSLAHHAKMGIHVVLDTSPPQWAFNPKNLPASVQWYHEPVYGHGLNHFRNQDAIDRAIALARKSGIDIVVLLDCDEFFTPNTPADLFHQAVDKIISIKTYHWYPDVKAYDFLDWHRRLGPAKDGIHMGLNASWAKHPKYNGNPQNHCFLSGPMPVLKVDGAYHHHVTKAVGKKHYIRYPGKVNMPWVAPLDPVPWPEDLELWRTKGIYPSDKYR